MRKSGICPKCSGNQVLDISTVPDQGDGAGRGMYLALVFEGHSFMGNEKISRVGKVSAAMCKGCGFAELYVLDPESVNPDGRFVKAHAG